MSTQQSKGKTMRTIIITAILMNAFVGSAASADGTNTPGTNEAKTVREGITPAENKPSVDWPCWRGPQRNGISSEADWPASRFAAEPEVLWKASVGTGFSSLAVVEGRVYTMGNSNDVDSVFCLDVETGKVLWKHSYNCPLARLAYQGGPSATPAVHEGRVYTLSKSGHVFCLDAATGKVLWSKKFDAAPRKEGDYRNDWGYAASPMILGKKLILSIGWAGMALDKTDGKLIWDNGPGRPGYSSPVPFTMDGQQCLAMHVARGIVAVETEGGKILWTIPWRTGWDQNASDVVVSDGKMFVSSGHRRGCALFDVAVDPPKEIWRNKAMSNDQSGFVLWNGYVYGVDNKRSLVCIDWQTGERPWSGPTLGRGTLILVDGQLIVLEETGKLAIAKATSEGFSPIAELQIAQTGRYWTTPTFSGGRLLVRNAAGDVVCIDARR